MPESPQNEIQTYMDPVAAPLAKLQPDAISGTQDVIIGMASSAPAASIGPAFFKLPRESDSSRH